mmetsp:Transcript_25726/g.58536  ORF Transcript_25726/g.58536 Transcript_25726/m.58536 type:complete len:441 (-) Transcript_25726:61-1383(-)
MIWAVLRVAALLTTALPAAEATERSAESITDDSANDLDGLTLLQKREVSVHSEAKGLVTQEQPLASRRARAAISWPILIIIAACDGYFMKSNKQVDAVSVIYNGLKTEEQQSMGVRVEAAAHFGIIVQAIWGLYGAICFSLDDRLCHMTVELINNNNQTTPCVGAYITALVMYWFPLLMSLFTNGYRLVQPRTRIDDWNFHMALLSMWPSSLNLLVSCMFLPWSKWAAYKKALDDPASLQTSNLQLLSVVTRERLGKVVNQLHAVQDRLKERLASGGNIDELEAVVPNGISPLLLAQNQKSMHAIEQRIEASGFMEMMDAAKDRDASSLLEVQTTPQSSAAENVDMKMATKMFNTLQSAYAYADGKPRPGVQKLWDQEFAWFKHLDLNRHQADAVKAVVNKAETSMDDVDVMVPLMADLLVDAVERRVEQWSKAVDALAK